MGDLLRGEASAEAKHLGNSMEKALALLYNVLCHMLLLSTKSHQLPLQQSFESKTEQEERVYMKNQYHFLENVLYREISLKNACIMTK